MEKKVTTNKNAKAETEKKNELVEVVFIMDRSGSMGGLEEDTIGGFNIGVTDYWVTGGPDLENRYFRYTSGATNHVFEAAVGYDFGLLAIRWFTNFAGNDALRADGRPAFSSYAELTVPFSLGGADWTFAAGIVPYATQYYEAERFALTNLSLTASVDIPVSSSFSLPLFATLAANPHTRKAFFVVGITLRP